MYQRNQNSDMHRLNNQQHNSLEKHQRMIDSALRWQRQHRSVTATEKTAAVVQRLLPVITSLINLLAK